MMNVYTYKFKLILFKIQNLVEDITAFTSVKLINMKGMIGD